jgi:acetylornithine deacetylase
VRHLPQEDPDRLLQEFRAYLVQELEPAMKAIDPETGFEIAQLSEIPALDTRGETQIVGLVQELTGNTEIGKVSYGTEGSQFQRAGIPTVVCGPGSIEQAHKPDEFIELTQIAACERFVGQLLERMTRS